MFKNLNTRERVLLTLNIIWLLLLILGLCAPIVIDFLKALTAINQYFSWP